MKNNNPPVGGSKLIVIVGPTASGKSDLAVKIARRVDGEIISADSRQVYRGMDIGTGKITKKERRGVAHHLLDVISPKTDFNISHFKRLAQKKITEITNQGKMPIVVGGTGFWVDALIYDWPIPEVRPNRALRARLGRWSVARLFAKLQKLDPERAKSIDRHNGRRLIRALEIVIITGKSIQQFNIPHSYNYNDTGYLILGIKISQKELEQRIYIRLIKRLKGGMIQEIKKLHNPPSATIGKGGGVSWKKLDGFGLEYRYVARYLRGQLTYEQMIEELYRAIKNYAKRQMRWFKRNPQIKWIRETKQAIKLVQKFIG